jgi:hypothetical protein
MSDANPKIPTPTTLLRLFSQPQIPYRKLYFCPHHPRPPVAVLVSQCPQRRRAFNPVIYPPQLQGYGDPSNHSTEVSPHRILFPLTLYTSILFTYLPYF